MLSLKVEHRNRAFTDMDPHHVIVKSQIPSSQYERET